MRYRLRTLLIVLALGPPVLAGVWYFISNYEVSALPDGSLLIRERLLPINEIPPYE